MRFRIDLKIFIFLILFYFTKQIEIYGFLMLFAFLHEVGHLLCGLLLGMKPEKIDLMSFGFSISFKINIDDYNKKICKANNFEIKKIIIAMAGPLTNLIIILITFNINLDIIKSLVIIYTNLLIMIFNLIPIYPLDGGRILRGLLYIVFGRRSAEKFSLIISNIILIIITSVMSILIFYIKNIAVVLIIIYLWYMLLKENKKYKNKEKLYQKILENSQI